MAEENSTLLTRPTKYNIEDSNIALLRSDIWRIAKFAVVEWPKARFGSFYDGDSYIVLHTYKPSPDSQELAYNLHFWLGSETTQDEAGTAAYKTVELDGHLDEKPVQYREIQGYESSKFPSYFPHFLCLEGGVSTGFHHVSSTPPDNTRRLYRVTASGHQLVVREVPPESPSLVPGDVYVLDMGNKVWQLNTKGSVGKERFKAAEFDHSLATDRNVTEACEVTVFDEGGHGAGIFLSEFGLERLPSGPEAPGPDVKSPAHAPFC
ncbi:uncharacterized protein PHACADRAFT_212211 [Phanerochaete carnosa HHB-10118-sp]|uniref:Gelsolin-like domain-containing protein n=1 Tax=Phanerochaete carnosa (strain HHB-10118-sp) TaxID=650164 RepID=K5UP75_PHACS|nr:uncharacterized protein PHACADRAFT_212211 [Phanerochaete carnosa HHB-10118-sp]EKM51571.1 hypothetical protein PHACADRAFT_212211 [Phanerochaete carnosa HHB-10118-sp]